MITPLFFALVALLLGTVPAMSEASEASKHFDVAAGNADSALKEFARQSGLGLLYSSNLVDGVKTRGVHGDYLPRQALTEMLEGTGLTVTQSQSKGALAISRSVPPSSGPPPAKKKMKNKTRLALLGWIAGVLSGAGAPTVSAQSAGQTTPVAPSERPPDEVVQMSQFVVRTTQGQGYVATNSAAAFKTDQSLMDIPQADLVVTSDLIKDIAQNNTFDVLQFVGISDYFQGESVLIRGSRDTDPYVDDMPDSTPYEDDVDIDTYEIIKGPAAVLYQNASLSGLVLKSTKKPLPFVQDIVTASIDQWGQTRETIDFTGPLGNFQQLKLSYRLVGAFQAGKTYFENLRNPRIVIVPTLEVDHANTRVILAYNFSRFRNVEQGDNFLTPTGKLYTGAGWSEGYYPPDDMEQIEREAVRGAFIQKLGDGWETRLSASATRFIRYGGIVYPNGINWATGNLAMVDELDDEHISFWTVQDDFNGKYNFGPIKNQSTFGFSSTTLTVVDIEFPSSNFGDSTGQIYIPVNSRSAVNSVQVPQPPVAYPYYPTNAGTRANTYYDNIYFQQQVDVIPDWLSLITGYTFAHLEQVKDTSISVSTPYTATDTAATQWLHRLGAIIHLGREFMIYGLESTSFSPGTGALYNNLPSPNVQGKGDEIGLKTNFLDGRISSTFSAFKMTLTNQTIVGPGLNPFGKVYRIVAGSTTTKGWDGDVAFAVFPGWQIIATGYVGDVLDQNGHPISITYDNEWTAFTRYDFSKGSALSGLQAGFGIARIGGRWISSGGMTVPAGQTVPAEIKMQEGTMVNAFVNYSLNRHWTFRVNCNNVLNDAYPIGAETAYFVNPSPPRTFSFNVSYTF